MNTAVAGTPAPAIPPTPRPEIDHALATLTAAKDDWARLPIRDRRAILGELIRDFATVAEDWAEAARCGEGIASETPLAGEEWLVGPYLIQRNLQLLDTALGEIERHGTPRIPGPVRQRPNGKTTARVFPASVYDRLFYNGFVADVWMADGVTPANLAETQATAYRRQNPEGRVCLVLGAGNVSSIGPMDALYKLFIEHEVVLYKAHPLNGYLAPLMERGFQALLDWGVLRVAHGGVDVGAYLCNHDDVETIHITGADKTVEAIVFGPGEAGQTRKKQRRPRLTKPISSELGNVSPVIVVPGPWSPADLAYQAENLAATLANNAGFNCNASRVVIQHAAWDRRQPLLQLVRKQLATIPTRAAYYPGAAERHAAFIAAHPEAERFGDPGEDALPWALIADVDSTAQDDICFRQEAFCGVFAETALAADSAADFLDQAVDFCNDTLWGTLNATILVHPRSLKDPTVARALDRALENLRYGTVGVNVWAAINFALGITPWGAYPGHDIYDIQSGSGVVHNTLMFSQVEKTVLRGPWRVVPKPMWFPSHKTALTMGQRLTAFETTPSPFKLPGIFWAALRA